MKTRTNELIRIHPPKVYICIFLNLMNFAIISSGRASFDSVASKYEQVFDSVAALFYPAKSPQRMLVSFSYLPRNYSMWSWFFDPHEQWIDTSYLFISDLRLPARWYLNDSDCDDFEKKFQGYIEYYMNRQGLKKNNLIFIGSSQAAYGALYHGIVMGVKAVIAFSPQVDKESAAKKAWYDDVINLSGFKDLQKIVEQAHYIPSISLYVSSYIKDFSAGQGLVNAIMKKNSFFMYTKIDKNYHGGAEMFGFNKQLVERDIMILESR